MTMSDDIRARRLTALDELIRDLEIRRDDTALAEVRIIRARVASAATTEASRLNLDRVKHQFTGQARPPLEPVA